MPNSIDPLVTVIIPTFNRSAPLKRALQSVLQQTETSFEILVLDDASEEDLMPIITALHDDRIRRVRNDVKTNANVMRNLGILNAKGVYCAFLDSDDEWLPHHLELKIQFLKKENTDGVYGSAFIFDGETTRYSNSRPIRAHQHAADYLLSGGAAPIPSWVIRTTAARDILFDETLHRHQDYDFFVRFAEKYKWKERYEPTIVVNWEKGNDRRRHPQSETQFIQRNFQHISPRVYFNYHLIQLHYYQTRSADPRWIAYYRRESMRYIHQLSFFDYCSITTKKSLPFSFLVHWFSFSLLLFWRKFKTPRPPVIPK